ncbi:TnsA endonuclease N-terminal domain-containing protein [Gilvimarinus sp. SDUM040013]|nr:TnsA endonuclease N-terminal domain-containing protein [Gilvimarinus sp. SDUM040013]MDO3388113.1 TnsA endonuclease N-terminal domain-containing protein [Gilvimarinus sp. SDUM040013]
MELARFDSGIDSVIPQPLTITYVDSFGVERPYTPDGLVYYREDLRIPPLLYEIKYRADLKDQKRQLLPKLRKTRSVARRRGWRFRVLTELEIRTPYLANAKFLWGYRAWEVEEPMAEYVLTILDDLGIADPSLLMAALFSHKRDQAKVLPVIWYLIANGRIVCDLDAPLTMKTLIRVKGDL